MAMDLNSLPPHVLYKVQAIAPAATTVFREITHTYTRPLEVYSGAEQEAWILTEAARQWVHVKAGLSLVEPVEEQPRFRVYTGTWVILRQSINELIIEHVTYPDERFFRPPDLSDMNGTTQRLLQRLVEDEEASEEVKMYLTQAVNREVPLESLQRWLSDLYDRQGLDEDLDKSVVDHQLIVFSLLHDFRLAARVYEQERARGRFA